MTADAVPQISSPTDLGEALRRLRQDNGLTQADVASVLGVDRKYVHEMEHGHPGRFVARVFDLLALYDISLQPAASDPKPNGGPGPKAKNRRSRSR